MSEIQDEERLVELKDEDVEIEDEHHFVFVCPTFYEIRGRYHCLFKDSLTLHEIFRYEDQRCLAAFLNEAFRLREKSMLG